MPLRVAVGAAAAVGLHSLRFVARVSASAEAIYQGWLPAARDDDEMPVMAYHGRLGMFARQHLADRGVWFGTSMP